MTWMGWMAPVQLHSPSLCSLSWYIWFIVCLQSPSNRQVHGCHTQTLVSSYTCCSFFVHVWFLLSTQERKKDTVCLLYILNKDGRTTLASVHELYHCCCIITCIYLYWFERKLEIKSCSECKMAADFVSPLACCGMHFEVITECKLCQTQEMNKKLTALTGIYYFLSLLRTALAKVAS